MRLIDADAVILNYGGLVHISPYDFQGIAKYFAEQIAAAPTIDAVPVVRCRECKFFEKVHLDESFRPRVNWCTLTDGQVTQNSFCGYGERKEADHE